MKVKTKLLLENVAAVSAEFHRDARYGRFYETYAEQLSGFPGIWKFCVTAGRAFTVAEPRVNEDWIETVDAYVDMIYASTLPHEIGDVASRERLDLFAARAVARHTKKGETNANERRAGPVEGDPRGA